MPKNGILAEGLLIDLSLMTGSERRWRSWQALWIIMFRKPIFALYRFFVMAIRESPMLRHRFGSRTLREILGALSWYFWGTAVRNPTIADGHRFYHAGTAFSMGIAFELHEPETVSLVRRLLEPGMTFVDAGAHIGWYTLLAARSVGRGGHVYAFEPDASNFELLRKNVIVNGYEGIVTLVNQAACDAPGRVLFFSGRGNSSSMFAPFVAGTELVEVEAISLDQFFATKGWPPVDLIKMDVEGAELLALRGMAELCYRNPTLKLVIEYSPANLKTAGATCSQVFEVLEQLGFRRKSIISRRLIPVGDPTEIVRRVPKAVYLETKDWSVNLLCQR